MIITNAKGKKSWKDRVFKNQNKRLVHRENRGKGHTLHIVLWRAHQRKSLTPFKAN